MDSGELGLFSSLETCMPATCKLLLSTIIFGLWEFQHQVFLALQDLGGSQAKVYEPQKIFKSMYSL
jgi:hypothetical protein